MGERSSGNEKVFTARGCDRQSHCPVLPLEQVDFDEIADLDAEIFRE